MLISYRQARLKEINIALDLLRIAALRLKGQNVDQWGYWLDPPPYKIKWLTQGFENGEYHFALLDHKIAGMYRLSDEDLDYWGPQNIRAKYIHSLVIHPDYKGQGLGRKIMYDIMDSLINDGHSLLRLDCHAGNKRLCSYYEDLGFKKVGEVEMPHSLNNLYEKHITE